MPIEYRAADKKASGFPIPAEINLLGMARPKVRSEFGKRLYDSRINAGLTQIQLAAKVHMVQSSLAELEWTGRGSSKTTQLAAACGVSAEWLATGVDKPIGGPWPLVGVVTPTEWALLPPEVKDDVLSAVEHYVSRHRRKHGSGKLSHSPPSDDRRNAKQ